MNLGGRRPYFEQGGVAIYHGTCVDVLADMPARSVQLVITDPPFDAATHAGAMTNKDRRTSKSATSSMQRGAPTSLVDFESIDFDDLCASFVSMGTICERWVIATCAHQHACGLERSPPSGLRFVRQGVWTKVAPMPQMSGDRPGQGWEAIPILHSEHTKKMRWNGGGRSAVWNIQVETRSVYPTQKPERLITALLADFGEPGDLVCDPFCGSGTTLLCAWKRWHKAIGCDIREAACEIAAKRIEVEMRQGRIDITRAPTRRDQTALAF